ncbi:hypothetical protein [Actinoplanes sp. N902-109]|uniref:hypothetical protein n=1 Tax=Actinoplanes sp. (strain N902-109) TaxID=649831 RepID=UPI00032954A4|nr:hypothetical protein [Actinoplanes sp. N902-109]AGL15824.1 hypothetical protein L083_2314 [Actinoplanes sp. N902-109]
MTTDAVADTLHEVLEGFIAVCGTPDDPAVAAAADDALARLDDLLAGARGTDD